MRVSLPPLSFFQIVFQVGISCYDFRNPPCLLRRNRRSAEIGVQDDARSIDDLLYLRTGHVQDPFADFR